MGYRITKFYFTPGENEQVEAVVKLQEEKRSMIHGIVKDHRNVVVKDAVVKLFEVLHHKDKCSLKPLTHIFTDECGQFMFGPLAPCKRYAIKVWVNHVKIREIIVCPEKQEEPCHLEEHEAKELTSAYEPLPPSDEKKKNFFQAYDNDSPYDIIQEIND